MSYRIFNRDDGETAEVFVYEEIGEFFGPGITAEQFRSDVRELGSVKEIDVHINSVGGDVNEGKAMMSTLARNPAKINMKIDSMAYSAAAVLAMSGDDIEIVENGELMIHRAWGLPFFANAIDLRKQADRLDMIDEDIAKVFAKRTGIDRAEIMDMLTETTFLSADDALSMGFVDRIVDVVPGIAASAHLGDVLAQCKNVPQYALDRLEDQKRQAEATAERLTQMRERAEAINRGLEKAS